MKYFSGSMVIFLHFLFLWVCIYSILCIWSGDPALEIFGILFFWGIFLKIFANFIWQYWKQKNCFEFREDENTNLLPNSRKSKIKENYIFVSPVSIFNHYSNFKITFVQRIFFRDSLFINVFYQPILIQSFGADWFKHETFRSREIRFSD